MGDKNSKKHTDIAFLNELFEVICQRGFEDPDSSYTAKLFCKGRAKIAQKVGEEAVETVIDAVANNKKETISESADLLFHLMVLWADMKITPGDVIHEMHSRHVKMKKKG